MTTPRIITQLIASFAAATGSAVAVRWMLNSDSTLLYLAGFIALPLAAFIIATYGVMPVVRHFTPTDNE